MPRAAPRSLACCSSSQTGASAYRLALVMNSQRSEASRNWWANSWCACTTESMSGVSSSATPLRHALAGGQHEQPVAARPGQALLADPGQRGQEHVLGEPVDVVGVAGQHRAVRRRAAHAGRADLGADDAVDQRGLARAGGADQGDQDGRRGLPDPGQQVVIDLAEQLGAFGLDLGGTGDLEDQRDGGDPLPEVEQGRLEQAGVHPGVSLRLGSRELRGSGGLRGLGVFVRGNGGELLGRGSDPSSAGIAGTARSLGCRPGRAWAARNWPRPGFRSRSGAVSDDAAAVPFWPRISGSSTASLPWEVNYAIGFVRFNAAETPMIASTAPRAGRAPDDLSG